MENIEKIRKTLSKSLLTKLDKAYPASSRIDDVFKGNDMTILTNKAGEAMHLFFGKRIPNGNIKGTHYERHVKERIANKITKSHWDNRGKVTGKQNYALE